MQYYSSSAKKIFPIPEPAVFPATFGFLNLLVDSCIILFHSLRNKRFFQVSKLAFILWLSLRQEINAERQEINAENSKEAQSKLNESRRKHAQWLLQSLTQLGAAFIKVGQFISTREDLMPKEYVLALSSLQDSVNPLPIELVEQTIHRALNKSIADIFDTFDPVPLASASIGQVHLAKTKNGKEVVVKVQRPDLEKIFLQDIAIARAFSVFFERHNNWCKNRYWPEICDEFGKVLFEEIDFQQEALNAERMKVNLESDHPELRVPKGCEEFSTRTTLVLEYIPGVKINDFEALTKLGVTNKWLSDKLLKIFLDQFFKHSFFHADPHQGNLAITKEGQIVLYDFGMVYKIDNKIKENFKKAIVALVAQNSDELIKCLALMDLIRPGADLELLKNLINKTTYKYYSGTSLQELNLESIKEDINKVIANSPVRMPPSLAYVFRTLGILEGLCRSFDPKFDFIKALKPYTKEWLIQSKEVGIFEKLIAKFSDRFEFTDFSELLEVAKIPAQANKLFQRINNNEFEIPINLAPLEEKISKIESITKGMAFILLGIVFVSTGLIIFQFAKLPVFVSIASGSVGLIFFLLGFKKILL
jgi:predicted unusual protein kinase regulating ubiquinone biosynthesis (AarF/ABC1/UbiB family)